MTDSEKQQRNTIKKTECDKVHLVTKSKYLGLAQSNLITLASTVKLY